MWVSVPVEVRRGEKGQHREGTARFDAQREKGGSDTNSGDRTRRGQKRECHGFFRGTEGNLPHSKQN